jgi:hypothetical protein
MTNDTEYNLAAIRELLLAAFTAEELRRFCADRPIFQRLVTEFGPGMGLDDIVDQLFDFCRVQLLWDELLVEVKQVNPRQYARFEPCLHLPTIVPSRLSVPEKPGPELAVSRRPYWILGVLLVLLIVAVAGVLAWLIFRDGPGLTPTPIPVEAVDQMQTGIDYGYWFEDDAIRWQEFIPTLDNVTAVEIAVHKAGHPSGDVVAEIRTVDGGLLGQGMAAEPTVPTQGWVRIDFADPIPVTPGIRYRLYVYSDGDSPSPDDRYFWQGNTNSTYCPSCETDVKTALPGYHYAFRTRGFR